MVVLNSAHAEEEEDLDEEPSGVAALIIVDMQNDFMPQGAGKILKNTDKILISYSLLIAYLPLNMVDHRL